MTCGLLFLAWRILQALINKLTIKVFKVLVKEVDKNEKFLHFCSPTPKTANLAVMDKVNSWFYMFSNQNPLFKILYHYLDCFFCKLSTCSTSKLFCLTVPQL